MLLAGVVDVLLVRHDIASVSRRRRRDTRPVASHAPGAAVATRAIAPAVVTSAAAAAAAEYGVHAEVQRRHRRDRGRRNGCRS